MKNQVTELSIVFYLRITFIKLSIYFISNIFKGKLKSTLGVLGRSKPDLYTHAADNIKELGSQFVYQLGTSFKKDDFNLTDRKAKRDKMFDQVENTLKRIDAGTGSAQDKYKKKVEVLR